jgi:hypothetical protein
MSRYRRKLLAPLILGAVMSGCQTNESAVAVPPPDAKAVILANKATLWKDPESIKNASITAPRRHTMGPFGAMWHVCVRLNARNSFGGYVGERDALLGLYDDGKPPTILADPSPYCDYPHEPFPELDGGYGQPSAAPRALRKPPV